MKRFLISLFAALGIALVLSPEAQTVISNNAADMANHIVMVADSSTARTVTNLFTFDRGAAVPFAVGASSLNVTNLDADKIDGYGGTGSWTPTLCGATSCSGQVYGAQIGRYVRYGKLVFVHGYIALTTLGTITGAAVVNGIPFTAANFTAYNPAIAVSSWNSLTTSVDSLSAYVNPNTTIITFQMTTAAAASTVTMAQADFSNTSSFLFSGVYEAQ